MPEATFVEALRATLEDEMRRDPSLMLIGEDIGRYGGIFGVTKGLLEKFGPQRVRSTPISESAIIGAALGAAMTGHPTGGRDHVRGLHRLRHGPDRQPGGQDALHVRGASSRCRW